MSLDTRTPEARYDTNTLLIFCDEGAWVTGEITGMEVLTGDGETSYNASVWCPGCELVHMIEIYRG